MLYQKVSMFIIVRIHTPDIQNLNFSVNGNVPVLYLNEELKMGAITLQILYMLSMVLGPHLKTGI